MPRPKPILFDRGKPSNFYLGAPIIMWCPLMDTWVTYPANEYYFHCAKTFGCNAGNMLKFHNDILRAPNCAAAKRLGRQVPLSRTEVILWDARVAIEAMMVCNLAKFTTHADCREWLVATGTAALIEHRPDPIWGDNMDGTGKNLLGKILEVVRAHVRELPKELPSDKVQQHARNRAPSRRAGRRP
jgi:ribA/ribD-fused uncharacterized protein